MATAAAFCVWDEIRLPDGGEGLEPTHSKIDLVCVPNPPSPLKKGELYFALLTGFSALFERGKAYGEVFRSVRVG